MNSFTIKAFSKSMMHGSKYTYRTVPRLLTIWLDHGENPLMAQQDTFKKMTEHISRAIQGAPVFKVDILFSSVSLVLMISPGTVVYSLSPNRVAGGPWQCRYIPSPIKIDRYHHASISTAIPLVIYLRRKIHQAKSCEARKGYPPSAAGNAPYMRKLSYLRH